MNFESQVLVSQWEEVQVCQFPIALGWDAVSMHGVY